LETLTHDILIIKLTEERTASVDESEDKSDLGDEQSLQGKTLEEEDGNG
jgi:hypothetical protein